MKSFTKRVLSTVCVAAAIPTVAFASTSTHTVHSVSRVSTFSSNASPAGTTPRYATVRKGDSLWKLSAGYHVSVTNLEKWNHLTAKSTLHIGQRLIVGYTSATTLSGRSGDIHTTLTGAFGDQIAQLAQRYVGAPYRWGGTSPSGFDCSGFVKYIFGQLGVSLPRTSYDMYNVGTSVGRSALRPGDLVFSNSYGPGASHVGIYIGGGRFIGAQSHGVEIASLNDGYWAAHYMGAKRVGK